MFCTPSTPKSKSNEGLPTTSYKTVMIYNGVHYQIIPGIWLLQIIRNFSAKRLRVDDIVVKIKSCVKPELVPRGYVQAKELTEKEYEYLPLTRDITESDIKQRREIKDGSAFYVDQAAIKAAIHGRVLVLDGIEKAERNVLPILNNLLENREVQLDDGRFLVSPDRYDSLLKQYSEDELTNNFRLVRVHEDFRVVALGLPVPKFRGYSLDPPLRSRFQGMSIKPKFFKNKVPEMPTSSVLKSCYPYQWILKKDGQFKVANILKTFNIIESKDKEMSRNFKIIKNMSGVLDVNVSFNGEEHQLQVPSGFGNDSDVLQSTIDRFVLTPSRRRLLTDLLLSHSSHDFCLVGPKGCGKSSIANRFASLLGYKIMPIMLYQDMTSRDLVQQRRMLPNGDTPIHPSFRIVALAEPPNLSAEASAPWFTSELMNLFLFHHVEPMNVDEEIEVISTNIRNVPEKVERNLLNFVESLKRNTELTSLARLLSTRQILRIMKRLTFYPDDCLYSAIHKACLSRFLPSLMRRNLENALEECSIYPSEEKRSMSSDGYHLQVIENMLRDFMLGEHLLLVGNQGVVRDGVIVYEDSPLVKAVKHGQILVIDEGDKAPTHVTVVLKSLLESGYMHLADGRSIVPQKSMGFTHETLNESCIPLHKNFRVIVLANRPGFPFLGNDFYNSLGDLFACHVVDNPSLQSELTMLKKYGPDIPDQVLNMLSSTFHQLRVMYEQGSLNYPYSTRELVSVVKHLQQYPNDPLSRVVGNVFDFDNFDKSTREAIFDILSKNGIATNGNGVQTFEIRILPKYKLPEPEFCGVWRRATRNTMKIDVNHGNFTVTPLSDHSPKLIFIDRIQTRTNLFTEQLASWQLPISDMSMVSDVLSLGMPNIFFLNYILSQVQTLAPPMPDFRNGGDIIIATVNPTSIFRLNTLLSNCYRLDLDADLFRRNDFSRSNFKPRLKFSRLNSAKFNDHLLVHEEVVQFPGSLIPVE
uniref:ATPase dynein-related AAA domain-containing protein n=1 Tax=Romanomermis culicivorax TaxID=13658 RepID=A0A915HU87_ROMCU